MIKIFKIALLLLLISCQKTNNTDILEPNNDGPNEVVDTDWCPKAELNLNKLECKARDGSDMSDGFTETCQQAQEEGGIFLNPRCIATSDSCDKIKKCPPD